MHHHQLLGAIAICAVLAPLPAVAGGALPTVADNSGAFTYSIPIAVPSGPAGAQPDLALQYSSAAGNGNAGMGFALPYSSISLDLSWGVPSYWLGGMDLCDPDSSAGRLFLDGMELVPSMHDPLAPNVCSLRTRPDTFGLVVPVWNTAGSCSDDHDDALADEPAGFAVVRPDGDVWWYGDHDGCSTIGRVRTSNSTGTHTSRWLLRHVSDRDGNLVTFWPERVRESDDASTLLGGSPYGGATDLRACDGCLRGVSWAERLPRTGDYAFDPDPVLDGGVVVDWQASSGNAYGATNRSVTGRFRDFLTDPAAFFPQAGNHYYFAQIDWEDRPDARVSYLSGEGARASRRIKQITVAADGEVWHLPDGNVQFDDANATHIRSYRLDYDMGPTGRSRLRRVWPVAGQYDPSGAYPSIAARDQLEWDPTAFGDDIDNPWELVWSGSSWLHSEGDVPELAVDMPIEAGPDETVVPWLGANWQEGGFPTIVLADMNGDSLPDLVQHDPELPAYPVYLDELMTRVSPHGDWLPNPNWNGFSDTDMSSPNFWVRYNNGERFLKIERGPLDPFALQEVADYIPGSDCDGDGEPDSQEDCAETMRTQLLSALDDPEGFFEDAGGFDCIPEDEGEEPVLESAEECWDVWFLSGAGSDLDSIVSAGSACEVYWTGGPTMLGLLGIGNTGITPAIASWCEHRSCAPYCESSSNANDGPFGMAHAGLLPMDTEFWTQGLELDDVLALETTKQPIETDEGSGGDLVLWRKYAVTRGSTGTVMGNLSQLADFFTGPFAIDPVLGALESQTRVRWVDGYARPSFQTRLYSEDVEILRGTGITTPLDMGDDAPEAVVALAGHSPVLEGLIHDTIDLNGDGVLDRVLGGGAVLESHVHGAEGRAVFNPDESAPKDLVVSTQHMPWFVAFGDPESGEFGDIQGWDMPMGDPLLGDDQPGQPKMATGDPMDPRMWQDNHFNLLGVWESTNTHARLHSGGTRSRHLRPDRGSCACGQHVGVWVEWSAERVFCRSAWSCVLDREPLGTRDPHDV